MSKPRGNLKRRQRKLNQKQRWAKRKPTRRPEPPEFGSGMELAMAAMALVGTLHRRQ